MSFLTNSNNMTEAQSFLEKKTQQVNLHDLEETIVPWRSYVIELLLPSRKCKQATKITRNVNKGLPSKRSHSEMTARMAFSKLAFLKRLSVFVFTKSTSGTNNLPQFDQKLFPCRKVAPVQPKVQGKQSGTDNLILATNEPLVPLPMTPLVWALIYSTNWRKLIKKHWKPAPETWELQMDCPLPWEASPSTSKCRKPMISSRVSSFGKIRS